jgi:Leucine-rich repeat (LRR) protein
LVRSWVAEGFASRVEVAEAYLEELVSRNLLQRESRGLTVDPIMQDFLICKAKEDNFLAYNVAGNSSHAKLQIRRLCLTSTDSNLDEDVVSHTRTLVVSGKQGQLDGVPFKAFKKLRVLVISGIATTRIQNGHLADICGLIWLKYLAILGCDEITELPREIGRLPNLETLDVRWTRIGKLPKGIVKLHRLETLDVSHTEVTELPPWIGILQSLKTLNVSDTRVALLPEEINNLERLETLDISDTKVAELRTWIKKLKSLKTLNIKGTMVTQLPREIGNLQRLQTLDLRRTRVRELPKEIRRLQHLRTLDLRATNVRELPCPWEVQNSINVLVGASDKLLKLAEAFSPDKVISSSEGNCRAPLSVVFFHPFNPRCEEPLQLPLLTVDGRHMKLPQWVKQDLCNVCSLDIRLFKLGEEDLKFLRQMPNLQALALRFEVLPREPVDITSTGFSKLETFYIDSRLPRMITFEERAMPELKHLEFKFYTGTASRGYSMGIAHLHSLEKVVFRCSEHYSSDGPGIRATIDAVRNEVAKHPNEEISLWVNDDNVFVRHARDKEKEALMEAEERRKSQLMAAEKRAQQDKCRGRGGIRS